MENAAGALEPLLRRVKEGFGEEVTLVCFGCQSHNPQYKFVTF